MYATLVGAYPRTPHPGRPFRLRAAYGQLERGELDADGFRGVQDELIRDIVAEQMDVGLGLLTDGQVRWEDPQTAVARGLANLEITGLIRYFDTNTYFRQPRATAEPAWREPILVEDWRFAASTADELAAKRGVEPLPVKAALVGPYTLGRLSDPGPLDRERLTLALAEALNSELRALFEAGAPLVQVDENALTLIAADDDAERRLAAESFRRLTEGIGQGHLSLAITMGSAEHAGAPLLYDAPFSSYLFDLIAGPDSWRVIAEAPGDRGIVAGVADARNTRPDDESVMIWAGRYAAALGGRGLDRVGLAPSTGLEYLPRDRAKAKIEALAGAAGKAGIADPEAFKRAVDPRMLDARSAAFGRYMSRTGPPRGDPLAGVPAGEGGSS